MSKFSVADYTHALQALMPTGAAWPRNTTAIQTAVLRALAHSYQKSDEDALALLAAGFPATATALLPEWELTLGLPDPCMQGSEEDEGQRQRAVLSKWSATGSLSQLYFIAVARALGFIISITEYRPLRAGMSGAGQPLNHGDWQFTWGVTVMSPPITEHNYIDYQQLVCMLTKQSPSETLIIFLDQP
ncbi:YmfQ family protein [Serratia fonticola]|uniref:YmfQ family protein n=1 Tax=Serratia fonticola TaxID=47917 RepID=UPI00301C2A27